MKYLLLVFLFLVIVSGSFSQCNTFNSPPITCMRWINSSTLEIDFDVNSMGGATPANIKRLDLYGSLCTPSKYLISTILIGSSWPTSTFVYIGANSSIPSCYVIQASCIDSVIIPLPVSDEVESMSLNATLINDTVVELKWNWDQTTLATNTLVQRKLPSTSPIWTTIGNPAIVQSNMIYMDTIQMPFTDVVYRVMNEKTLDSCVSLSNEDTVYRNWTNVDTQLKKNSNIEIYPNPFKNYVHLKSVSPIRSIEVYSTSGQVVLVVNNPSDLLDLSSLPKGSYILKLISSHGYSRRLIYKN